MRSEGWTGMIDKIGHQEIRFACAHCGGAKKGIDVSLQGCSNCHQHAWTETIDLDSLNNKSINELIHIMKTSRKIGYYYYYDMSKVPLYNRYERIRAIELLGERKAIEAFQSMAELFSKTPIHVTGETMFYVKETEKGYSNVFIPSLLSLSSERTVEELLITKLKTLEGSSNSVSETDIEWWSKIILALFNCCDTNSYLSNVLKNREIYNDPQLRFAMCIASARLWGDSVECESCGNVLSPEPKVFQLCKLCSGQVCETCGEYDDKRYCWIHDECH
jgi:hypothetical protein